MENSAHNTPVGVAWESDSSSQLVGGAPQQNGRTSRMGERTEARPTPHPGAVGLHGWPPKFQCAMVDGEGCPLLPQTREHQTLTDTPLLVRPQDAGVGAGAAEGVGRGNGWHLLDWICQSLSQPIQEWR